MWTMLIAGLILPVTAEKTPFVFECEETATNQVLTSMGPKRFMQRENTRVQRYRIDPGAASVTRSFIYRSESEPWVEDPRTYQNALFTPGGRVVFCERSDGSTCMTPHRETQTTVSGATKTTTFITGPTILHLERNTMSSWDNMDVQASDRSYYSDFGMVEGKCRRL